MAEKKQNKHFLLVLLAAIGPGIVAELAGNDAGGISTFSVAGAEYGYNVLWTIPVAMVFLMLAQEGAMRLGAKTGKGFAALIREHFGIRWTAFAILALVVANFGTTMSEFAGIASGLELFGISPYIGIPVCALGIWALLMSGSYKRTQRIFLVVSLVFIVYVVAAFAASPDWGSVTLHTALPQMVFDRPFLALTIGIVGTTIAPWMLFFGQSNTAEKGGVSKDKQGLALRRADVFVGAVLACLVVWFIIITTGTVLHSSGVVVNSAEDAAMALAPIAGQFAKILFGAGLLGASVLAACVLPMTTAYAVCEAFGFEHSGEASFKEAPVYKGIITCLILFCALVVLIPGVDLLGVMLTSQVINGILLPILLIFLLLLANDKHLMGSLKNGLFANICTTLMIVVIIVLTVLMFIF
ncbi:MAG: Nramp family divalent metal transporter [Coriobacteriales bacterium]|jgi:NRAMP (natural resistance-associated macrophage protein)-like metal ion transporter|nr:Nramp family divalent metal transporter [Coriobacteriales bacterium]